MQSLLPTFTWIGYINTENSKLRKCENETPKIKTTKTIAEKPNTEKA